MPVLFCGAIAASAGATNFVSDNFDSYTSQANFEATWVPIAGTAPTSAEWSTAQAVSPTHSARVPGTLTTGQNRNRRTFSETGGAANNSNYIVWSFDFYDSDAAASPYRNYSNLQDTTAPSGTNQLISMGMNNNQFVADSGGNYYMARILGYSPVANTADPDGGPNETKGGTSAYFKLNDYGVGTRSTGWHNLMVHISTNDGASTDYAFYVDGQLAETVNNIGSGATIRSYDNIALGSGVSNANLESFFDNMQLDTYAPEPASLSLIALGGFALLGRKRRVQRA
jgi:hypothetical protein